MRTAPVERLGSHLRSGRITATELAERSLVAARRNEHQGMVLVTEDIALRSAADADRELRAGLDRGPLHGIPVALKDVIDVAGVPTRLGTAGYGHRTPTSDAGAWRALRAAGAVLVGKTRLPDLALGVVTPGVVNPRRPDRVAGGSSGGSAAVVAAGVVPIALGTDTGGSIRIPAALTGIVGLRPTHGALGTEGVASLSPSQDTLGVMAADALDCLVAYRVLRGEGGRRAAAAWTAPPAQPMRIGVPEALWRGRATDAVAASFTEACRALADAGHDLTSCELPSAASAPAVSYLVLLAEAAQRWGTPDEGRPLSARVARELATGRRVVPSEYHGARLVAAEISGEVRRLLAREVDVIALPTTAAPAAPIDVETVDIGGGTEALATAYCRFTALASVAGLPAISVPSPVGAADLPVGIQFIAAPNAETMLCRLAAQSLCGDP